MPDLDGAVIDAPVLDAVDDQQVDDQVLDDAAGADDKTETVEVKGDDRVLPQWIRNLKNSDPTGYRDARNVFFGKRTLDEKLKDFDLDGTKSFLEEHGGRESLATTLAEMQGAKAELDGLFLAAANGDRSLVDRLAESPEGFAKLAPAIAEKWAQQDPEGWDHAMSGIFSATIQQSGVPMHLERMGMQLEQMKFALEANPQLLQTNPALASAWNSLTKQLDTLKGWAGSFAEKAGKQLQRQQTQQPDKLNEREQGVAAGEQRLFDTDLKRDVDGFRDPLITKELGEFFKRRPDDADARDLAIANVRTKVVERMSADKDFQANLNKLTARRDKEGALRLIKSRETTAIQEIAPKVGRMIFGNPGPVKVEKKADEQRRAAPRTQGKPSNKFDEIWASA